MSSDPYGMDSILQTAPERLYGHQPGSIDSLENIEGERFVIFPYETDFQDFRGIGILNSQDIVRILDGERKFPLVKTLEMGREKVNKVNRERGNVLLAQVEQGRVSNMGYALNKGQIEAAWTY